MYLIALTLPHPWDLHQKKKKKERKVYTKYILFCSYAHWSMVKFPWPSPKRKLVTIKSDLTILY